MLSPDEKSQLIAALRIWAKTERNQPVLGFIGGGKILTPWEIVSAVERESEDGEAVLEVLEHGVRREGISRVVGRLTELLTWTTFHPPIARTS
ncbi:hypothetical protein [Nevskia soli]|jgi:hypothetical protein|uniref:hypothetical protein n=1 Tax=Nevskia soli TaxID=418856 RepID=UPI0015D6FF6E|nr:hypothetical protein [Nevskia soli]